LTRFSHGDLNILNVSFSTIAVENSSCQKIVDDFSTVRQKSPYFKGLALINRVSHSLLKTFCQSQIFKKIRAFVEKIKRFSRWKIRSKKIAHLLKTRKKRFTEKIAIFS
jgi:hypothetical protein